MRLEHKLMLSIVLMYVLMIGTALAKNAKITIDR
jgi:hypothetical protein